jgi:hypothetical protein
MSFRKRARKRRFSRFFASKIYNLESAMKLSLFVMIMTLASCSASQTTAPATPWKVSLTSSGGFAGRGHGSQAIDSSGAITVATMGGKTCSFDGTEDDVRRFGALLAAAKPEAWKASYIEPGQCCDMFEYQLTVDIAGQVSKTEWIDEAALPADLAALAEALTGGESSLRVRYGSRCE